MSETNFLHTTTHPEPYRHPDHQPCYALFLPKLAPSLALALSTQTSLPQEASADPCDSVTVPTSQALNLQRASLRSTARTRLWFTLRVSFCLVPFPWHSENLQSVAEGINELHIKS